jgi:hypothetical protein
MSPAFKFATPIALSLAALASGCATPPAPAPDIGTAAMACDYKYGDKLPPGAIPAKPVPPIAIPPQREPRSAYACVLIVVGETGQVLDAKLLETDSPAFGAYFLDLARKARYEPATLDGKPFQQRSVVSGAYW